MASNHTIGTWIERRASVAPDRVALIFGDTRRTYAEFAVRVRRLAHQLRALGVKRADRVSWLGPNHPAFLECLFATAKIGAVLAPINHRLDRGAVEAICEDVGPRVVFIDALPHVTLPPVVTATLTVGPWDALDSQYERLLASGRDEPIDEPVAPDDLCLLPFTSGTTGAPKGIMLSHSQLIWNVINCVSAIEFSDDDVTIAATPFFRTGGIGVNVLPVLFKGGTIVVPRSTDPESVFDLVERHRTTIGFGNPDMLEALARPPRWRSADLSSLRLFITGGAPVSERLLRTCHERGFNVVQGYGLSEAAPLVSVLEGSDSLRKVGSAGRPAFFVDVRIVRPDGTDAAVGEIGELLVRGPNVMTGYWRRPEATRRAIDKRGWLRTGDAVNMDAEGFLFIVGRVEDAYVSGGRLVHPGVAERLLLQHPAVAEVCVRGGDDGAVAYIVVEPGAGDGIEEELWSLCRDHLPPHARPSVIERVASFPKNPSGKIMRHLMHSRQAFDDRQPAGREPSLANGSGERWLGGAL